jgi:hypothetical protein
MRKLPSRMSVLFCSLAVLLAIGLTPQPAQGGIISTSPLFFPPYTCSGTVVELETVEWDRDTPPTTCTFWEADNGWLFFFDGLEEYEVGDRLMVSGNLCFICLVYNECGIYAAPILNAKIQPLDPPARRN